MVDKIRFAATHIYREFGTLNTLLFRSVGWVEQGETQHTQQSFFHPLEDVYIGSVARNETLNSLGRCLNGANQFSLSLTLK
jgi:hypothetical protein